MNNASSNFKWNGRPSVIKHLFLAFKFLNMTTIKNLLFWNSFSCWSILSLTWAFGSFWNHSLQSPIHSLLRDWKKRSFIVTGTTQVFPMSNHLCYHLYFKNMNTSRKFWSYTNLIDSLNSGWKGRTLHPPPIWKPIVMNRDIVVIRINDTVGAASFRLLIPTNNFPFRWGEGGDGNYKKVHK